MSGEQAEALEVGRLIGRLRVGETAALVIGADFWHTAAIARRGGARRRSASFEAHALARGGRVG